MLHSAMIIAFNIRITVGVIFVNMDYGGCHSIPHEVALMAHVKLSRRHWGQRTSGAEYWSAIQSHQW